MAKTEKQYSIHYVKRLRAQINRLNALLKKDNRVPKEENSHKIKTDNKKNGWKNFGLVFFTGVIAFVAIFQYVSFQKFSKKNSRAYLSVINPTLDTLRAYGEVTPRITYTIQNTGKTPAYEVTSIIYFEHQWKSIGPTIPDTTNRDKYIYAPGNTEHTKLFKQGSAPKDSTIDGDELRRFFFGRIEYFDIFKECHWLTFAYEYVWRHKEGGKFEPYPKYNDTDKK